MPDGSAKGANAEIILVRRDGAVVLQHRDDKPGIANPDCLSAFGGHIEAGEDPQTAAVREINEETNLRLTAGDLIFFKKYRKTKAEHGEDWDVYYFVANEIDDTNLEVYEGQGYKIIRNPDELAGTKCTRLIGQALGDYFRTR